MRAIVTGATGFLGRRLVRALCENGRAVCSLVRAGSDLDELRAEVGEDNWPRVEIRRASLLDRLACQELLASDDVVYHVAAGLTGTCSNLFQNTVVTTRALIEAAAAVGVKRFVLVSSLGVYGTGALKRGSELNESTPLDPHPHLRDPYTYSKIRQEQVTRALCRQLDVPLVVVRPGVIFGPGRSPISNRIGLQFGGMLIRMGGRQTLPYTYVENCAEAVMQAGLALGIEGEAFNIVDDGTPTARGLMRALRTHGIRMPTVVIPERLIGPLSGLYERYHRHSRGQLPGVITRYRSAAMWKPLEYSNRKARQRLGWQPGIPFTEALEHTIQT